MHYRFSRMSFVLPFTFCRASQKARYIFLCDSMFKWGVALQMF